MANIKISELNALTEKADNDLLAIVDTSADETKKIQVSDLMDKNIELIAVTDTAPLECSIGDKYYNTTDKEIYTATATNTWSATGTTPISGILYIVYNEQASYSWDGTDLVSVGGGKEDIVIDDTEPTDSDVKIWIDTSALSQSDETNMKYNDNGEYKDIYAKAFDTLPIGTEVDYTGDSVPDGWTQVDEVVWTNPNPTSNFSSTELTLDDTYSKVKIVFKRKSDEDYYYISGDIYNDNNYIGTIGLASNLLVQRLSKLDGTKLNIANGFKYSTYGSASSQDNSMMIPVKVYGYK